MKTTKKEIVEMFLTDNGFQEMVEKEIGKVLKCEVNWDDGTVLIQSARSGKKLQIDDIIKAYNGVLIQ
jgi:hypothetical protein